MMKEDKKHIVCGPQIPSSLSKTNSSDEDEDDSNIGSNNSPRMSIGPQIPSSIGPQIPPSIGPKIPPSIGPLIPSSIGPKIPLSIGPHVPSSSGPKIPPSIGPHIPSSIGPHIPPSIGPQIPSSLPYDIRSEGSDNSISGPQTADDSIGIGPQLSSNNRCTNSNIKSYGPALPPSFDTNKPKIIGPSLQTTSESDSFVENVEDDDDDEIIGPSLPIIKTDKELDNNDIQKQFEARAKAMKDKLTGDSDGKPLQRESWMTELPPEMGKNFGLGPRTFRTKVNDLGDRSVWTDTPADRERKRKEAMRNKGHEPEVKKAKAPSPQAIEMKKQVEEYNQKNRPQSLLEMQREKMKDEQPSTARRPFDRDRDLGFRLSDPKRKQQLIDSAKKMNDKFSAGTFEDKFL